MWSSIFSSNLLIECLLIFIPIFYYFFERRKSSKLYSACPRPLSTLPFIGNTLDVVKYQRHRLHDWLHEECERHEGKCWLLSCLGRPPSLIVTTTDAIEDVLQTQFEIFEKGKISRDIACDLFGEGIIAIDGEKWLHQRTVASHLFSHSILRTVGFSEITRHVEYLMTRIAKACEQQEAIDFKILMEYFTMDVFTKLGFGVDLNGVKGSVANLTFMNAFSRATKAVQRRTTEPAWIWKLKRFLDIGSEKELKEDVKALDNFAFNVVKESIARKTGQKQVTEARDLISLFLEDSSSKGQVNVSAKYIRDMTLTFIAAGKGTTSHSICWMLVMLNRYPDVLENIREELADQVPHLVKGKIRTASLEDIKKLVYLEAAIKESLRLNPVAPVNGRIANKDTILSDGTFVQKGTRVAISSYAIARLKSIWGEDACEYKPQRWIDSESGKLVQFSPYKFIAFHAGPRYCLGANLAIMEFKITLASLLCQFELKTVKDPFEVTYDMSLSLPVKGPLMIRPQLLARPTQVH